MMRVIGWLWFVSAALNVLANIYAASKGGSEPKGTGECALDAVAAALLAAWIYEAMP